MSANKRFRIAFSFAGEKRDFVAKVAGILAKRFGEAAILYDKYHQAEFSRSDLAFYLPDLYEKKLTSSSRSSAPTTKARNGAVWSGTPSSVFSKSAKVAKSCSPVSSVSKARVSMA
jgi:hypothetical protein